MKKCSILFLLLNVLNLVIPRDQAQAAGTTKLYEGITITPTEKHPKETFYVTFKIKEMTGQSITYEEITCAILDINGNHLFDLGHATNVTVPAYGSYTYNSSGYVENSGTYQAVARGKVPGGNWFGPWYVTGDGDADVEFEVHISQPTLVSPTNYSIFKSPKTINFQWSSVSGAKEYHITVFRGSNVQVERYTTNTSFSTSNSGWENDVYYWHVRARDDNEWSPFSERREFISDTPPPPPPSSSSPPDGSIFSIGATQTFSWTPPPVPDDNVDRYYLRIVKGTNLNDPPTIDPEPHTNSFDVLFSKETWQSGDYIWGVRAMKQVPSGYDQQTYEQEVGWGSYITKTFKLSNSAPTLISPDQNSTINTEEITFRWSDVGADYYELYVDNNPGLGSPEVSPYNIVALENYASTEYTLGDNWLNKNIYYWKVIAHFDGQTTQESIVGEFSYSPPTVPEPVWVPFYRLYNATDNDHFYCSSEQHRQTAIEKGFIDERVEGFISIKRFDHADRINLYRLYDGVHNCHFYTSDGVTRNSKIIEGLIYEGITGFTYNAPHDSLVKLYHLSKVHSSANHDHFYTISQFEKDNAISSWEFTLDTGFQVYLSPNGNSSKIPVQESQLVVGHGVNAQNGNFRHYSKTSFAMASTGMPLVFEHIYNSTSVFLAADRTPLGPGWSHTYNIYLINYGAFLDVFWPDGSIHTYDASALECLTPGVYDWLNAGYNQSFYDISKKNHVKYHFEQLAGASAESPFVLQYIEDRNGNRITCTYDNKNRLESVTGTTNRTLEFDYYADTEKEQLIQKVTESGLGRFVTFEHGGSHDLVYYTDPNGHRTSYLYNIQNPQDHLLEKIQLPEGNIISNVYEDKKIKSQQIANSSKLVRTPIANGANIKDDVLNYEIDCMQNADDLVTEIVDKSGTTGSIKYWYEDSNHPTKPTKIRDSRGYYTYIQYGSRGNVEQIDQPENITHKYVYTSFNDVDLYTDPRNNEWDYEYNGSGNLTKIIDPEGNAITLTPQSNGLVTSIENQMLHATQLTYDSHGNLRTVTPPGLPATQYAFDTGSRLKEIINAESQSTNYDYYSNDLLKQVVDAASGSIDYYYDQNDNLERITDQLTQPTYWSYTNEDLLDYTQNALGNKTDYSYNADGSLSSIAKPAGPTVSYHYDNSGRVDRISAGIYSADLILDDNGNIENISASNGQNVSMTYDGLNRLLSCTDKWSNIVAYTYDGNGNITSIVYPGNKKVTYTYYDNNWLRNVKDWNNKLTNYYYRADGQIDYITYPNGCRVEYSYDSSDRMTGLRHEKSTGEVICSYSYVLDNIGNIISETRKEPYDSPSLSDLNISLQYDAANRLQSAGADQYVFDANGNIESMTGSRNLNFTFDHDNNLTAISGDFTATYEYDALGNRRQATRDGVTTRYVLDIAGDMSQVLMEKDGANNTIAYYIYGIGLIYRIKADGTYQYYHFNNVGSTIAMTDQNQKIIHKYCYDPFGKITNSQETEANPFRFVGQYGVMYEGNGLCFMRARYFETETSRFISEDPLWSSNLYSYANNNPIRFFDPLGKTYISIDFFFGVGPAGILSIAVDENSQFYVTAGYGLGLGAAAGINVHGADSPSEGLAVSAALMGSIGGWGAGGEASYGSSGIEPGVLMGKNLGTPITTSLTSNYTLSGEQINKAIVSWKNLGSNLKWLAGLED